MDTQLRVVQALAVIGVLGLAGQVFNPATSLATHPISYLLAAVLVAPWVYVAFLEEYGGEEEVEHVEWE